MPHIGAIGASAYMPWWQPADSDKSGFAVRCVSQEVMLCSLVWLHFNIHPI
jgi:hypothetical protein